MPTVGENWNNPWDVGRTNKGLDIGYTYVWPYATGSGGTSYIYQYRLTEKDIEAIADKVAEKLLGRGTPIETQILRPEEV